MWVDILSQGWFVGTHLFSLVLCLHQESNAWCALLGGRTYDGQNAWSSAAFHFPLLDAALDGKTGLEEWDWVIWGIWGHSEYQGVQDCVNLSPLLRTAGCSKWLCISLSLREMDLEFTDTHPLGTLAKQWPWRALSVPRVTGTLLSFRVPHESSCNFRTEVRSSAHFPAVCIFSSGLGGLFAPNLIYWK